jgi:PAS domain S-box-containing protein
MRKNSFVNIFRPVAQGCLVPFMATANIVQERRMDDLIWSALETGSRQDAGANNGLEWMGLLGGALLLFVVLLFVFHRQKREAILARSDIEFRALSDSALAGIVQVDLTGKVRYANESAARMFGLSPQELMQNGMARYASDPSKRNAMLKELQSAGQVRDYELDIQNARGENRHLLFSASLQEGVASVSLVDMTDRMLAEKELRRFSRVVSQMADTVVITDIEGAIEYVNPAFEELTGYSSAEALGKTPRIIKSDHHNLEFYEGLWKTILKGEVFRDEIVNRKKNGELYYETKTITPIRDSEGKITHFVATAKDITARKQMEESLREKEAEFHLIANNTGDVIWVLDLESQRFTYVSPSVKKLRGLTPEEVMAQPMSASMTPGSMQKVVEELPARLELFARDQTQSTYTDTLDQYRKDGSIVQIEVTTTFVRTEQDKIQVVGISRDITEKKLAAEMLLKNQKSLEHAQAIAHLGNWEMEPQNGTGLFWSKEMYNLFQRDPLQGPPSLEEFMQRVHPDDREPLISAQQIAIDTGAVVSIEYSAMPPGDEIRYFGLVSDNVRV